MNFSLKCSCSVFVRDLSGFWLNLTDQRHLIFVAILIVLWERERQEPCEDMDT